jgi:hypothetical protein
MVLLPAIAALSAPQCPPCLNNLLLSSPWVAKDPLCLNNLLLSSPWVAKDPLWVAKGLLHKLLLNKRMT